MQLHRGSSAPSSVDSSQPTRAPAIRSTRCTAAQPWGIPVARRHDALCERRRRRSPGSAKRFRELVPDDPRVGRFARILRPVVSVGALGQPASSYLNDTLTFAR
jgi:hypothetical protein